MPPPLITMTALTSMLSRADYRPCESVVVIFRFGYSLEWLQLWMWAMEEELLSPLLPLASSAESHGCRWLPPRKHRNFG